MLREKLSINRISAIMEISEPRKWDLQIELIISKILVEF